VAQSLRRGEGAKSGKRQPSDEAFKLSETFKLSNPDPVPSLEEEKKDKKSKRPF